MQRVWYRIEQKKLTSVITGSRQIVARLIAFHSSSSSSKGRRGVTINNRYNRRRRRAVITIPLFVTASAIAGGGTRRAEETCEDIGSLRAFTKAVLWER